VLLAALNTGTFGWWDVWIIASCGVGAFLMRGAGCTWNDITDRDIDAQVARTRSRPLPSGQVGVRGAILWMVLQAILAFGILISYGLPTIWVGIASLVFVCIYPFAKRFTWWPQVFLGLAFNWGALVGWVAHQGNLTAAPVLLYLSGIVWTLFYDTIYAHQDADDDALIGVKSTARLFGVDSPKWLLGFAVLSAILMAASVYVSVGHNHSALILCFSCVLAYSLHMLWQLRRLDINNSPKLLRLFHANRDAGLILVPFFAAALLM
jgi:4-hydroxybenzoate polyprenyltransferase